MTHPGSDELRDLVRQVLADVLPRDGALVTPAPGPAVGAQPPEEVLLRTDAELDGFVRRIVHLADNPKSREDVLAGRLRFTLAAGGRPGRVAPTRRVERGAVTEAHVKDAARSGATLVLAKGAVLTPLARDRARALGVAIEKEA